MFEKIKNYVKNNKRILFILYAPLYMFWFTSLEKWKDRDWNIIHCALDDKTPFIDLFIIPYYLWFVFVAFFCIYFYFKVDAGECVKMYASLEIGMTLTLIIYTIWPNAVHLRPDFLNENGICAKLVRNIWNIDTDTNVCPSLHVLNTLIILVAYYHSGHFKKKHLANIMVTVLAILICVSTGFLKQHSWIDVIAAVIMCALLSILVYVPRWGQKKENTAENALDS